MAMTTTKSGRVIKANIRYKEVIYKANIRYDDYFMMLTKESLHIDYDIDYDVDYDLTMAGMWHSLLSAFLDHI